MSTPYELRFKVLEMARELCYSDFYLQENVYTQLNNTVDETIRGGDMYGAELLLEQLEKAKPVPPSPEQIKAKAVELYEFIVMK
jgi:AraC-like DNA-binding protein